MYNNRTKYECLNSSAMNLESVFTKKLLFYMLLLIVPNLILHKTQIVGYKDGKSNLNKNGVKKSLKDPTLKRVNNSSLKHYYLNSRIFFQSILSYIFKFMIFIQVGFVHYWCIKVTSHDLSVSLTSSNYS